MTWSNSGTQLLARFISAASIAAGGAAWAQYAIHSSTVDCGGGISIAGAYAVAGTIGQPEAGAMAGGIYILQGGFWSHSAPPGVTPGDMNCDGGVTVGDISGFVLALTDPAAYAAQYPACDAMAADTNEDGLVSVGDIASFVCIVSGSGC